MNQSGLCLCGCGGRTSLAPKTMASRGWIKGQPLRYIHGHSGGPPTRIWDESAYVVADLGYVNPCLLWTGSVDRDGYGRVRYRGELIMAHRWAWIQLREPFSGDLDLDHLCHDPATCSPPCQHRRCINVEHLEPVTHQENVIRGATTKVRTDAQRLAIRDAVGTHEEIAQRFGVSDTLVWNIKHDL